MTEELHEMEFLIRVTSYGKNDRQHQLEIGGHICRQMHLAFGTDRVKVFNREGKRLIYDPAAAAGSRPIYDSVVEAPTEGKES